MNCNTCRYELSQCLDGRLPSGRRAIVMQHTISCETCATFWDDIQAAQQLTLQLPRQQVSEPFREQLWQRIRVGEGTPNAVFSEPVPTLLKVRYTFTGAAAAAAVLLFGLWLRNDPDADNTKPVLEDMAVVSKEQPRIPTPHTTTPVQNAAVGIDPMSVFTSTQRFTPNLYVAETASQFEVRYASVDLGLRQLDVLQGQARDRQTVELIVERILTDANELRVFAEVLLEMREYDLVWFRDPEVGADLRVVTNMLMPQQLQRRTIDTVNTFVAPAVQQSRRLQRISRDIRVTPTINPQEEAATLVQLNIRRPEVFTKLFIVIGQGDDTGSQFGLLQKNHRFLFEGVCGSIFVAPRSQLRARIRVR